MPPNLTDKISPQPYADLLRTIGQVAEREGIEVYAVGGVTRDLLLGRPTCDLDFVSIGPGTGIALANAVADVLDGSKVHQYPNFGTAAIRVGNENNAIVLEFVGARKESYRKESRKPIVEEGTLEDDQRRRDFTINAMGIHLSPGLFGDLIDPFDGQADLAAGLIRTPLEPENTFADDPLRMIRAIRFATQLDFRIEASTYSAIKTCKERIRIVSMERIIDELQKIMLSPAPSIGFKLLEATGLLAFFFKELVALKGVEAIGNQRHKDNFFHTLQVVDNLVEATLHKGRPSKETLWLRWAALLHDIAKPRTKRFSKETGWTFHGHEDRGSRMVPGIFKRLKLPLDDRMRYVKKLVYLHHRPVALVDDQVTDSAVRRLLFEAGEDIDDLMTLVRADITSKNPRRVQRYLRAFDHVEEKLAEVEEKDRLRNFQPPVDGKEIMETLNLQPGRAVGILKNAIREAILDGTIPNEHEAAFAYLMEIKDEVLKSS